MKYHTVFLIIFSAALQAPILFGQKSQVLESYITEGLSKNLQIKQQQLNLQKAQENIRQSKALFYPKLSFEANYTLAAGGRNIQFPIGDLFNPVYENLNAINAVVAPGSLLYPELKNQEINFLPNNFQETKVQFSYPIYNTDLKYNRQIQDMLYQSEAAKKMALENEIRHEIEVAYIQYLQALEAEGIWQSTKTVLVELKRFNESLVKNNVATRDLVITAEYELSKTEQEIYKLTNLQNSAKSYFNYLVFKDLQSEIKIDTGLLKALVPNYNLMELIQMSPEKRKEFEAIRSGINASALDIKRNEANLKRPDIYLGGETGFQGFGYHLLDNQAFVLARVGLTYDLYDAGQRKIKTQQARIEQEKINTQFDQVKQQVALQITNNWNELETARNGLKASQFGINATEETFRIVNNKYRAGQVLLLEWLNAQNRVTIARLQHLINQSDILVKESMLLKASGL